MDLNIENASLSGRKAHIWQRISAIYLMFYIPFLAAIILQLPASPTLSELSNKLSTMTLSTAFALTSLIALILMVVHAWVGVRDILIDYAPRVHVTLWLTIYRSILALVLINCSLITLSLFS
ncbi:MAG: succinate dehydrogenase/fumarate reductase, membrane anchor subunit [Thiomicrorhabdus sp.]|nr:MAG: succinate dehydrogenase/fumarate reductase, membrane anchor subunit [Thiomicrorhabdus sp.]